MLSCRRTHNLICYNEKVNWYIHNSVRQFHIVQDPRSIPNIGYASVRYTLAMKCYIEKDIVNECSNETKRDESPLTRLHIISETIKKMKRDKVKMAGLLRKIFPASFTRNSLKFLDRLVLSRYVSNICRELILSIILIILVGS